MRRIAFFLIVVFSVLSVQLMKAKKIQHVDFVHPICWYSGMENPLFQLLIHGDNIADMTPSLENAKMLSIEEVVKVKNPNYLILYINSQNAPAQTFEVKLSDGKKTEKIPYELKQKTPFNRKSFDASDVVYLLMPDRFANGNTANDVVPGMRENVCDSNIPLARHGGDLQGMTDKLDYLADLGITAIWPTPILENDMEMESYHGYAITNYYKVDPRYGTNEDYRNFVEQAHRRGIKIVKDMVFNHSGSFNPLFKQWDGKQLLLMPVYSDATDMEIKRKFKYLEK